MQKAEQYRTYLEFHNSNWYCYWDTDSPPVRNRQVMQAWHITTEHGIWEFAYDKLKDSINRGNFQKSLREMDENLTPEDTRNLEAAAICFINGVQSKYPL